VPEPQYHITVNGHPLCTMSKTINLAIEYNVSCQQFSRSEGLNAIARIKGFYPGDAFLVKAGPCPVKED
jgi:hypothetical protein